jgi:hypothetical protein
MFTEIVTVFNSVLIDVDYVEPIPVYEIRAIFATVVILCHIVNDLRLSCESRSCR